MTEADELEILAALDQPIAGIADDEMLDQFGLEPDVDLGVMRPEQRLSDLTAELMCGLGDALADVHFCPTPGSAANLIAESVPADQVYVTGNTVIDALLWAVKRARSLSPPVPRTRPRRILRMVHRRESPFGDGHASARIATALVQGSVEHRAA